MNASVSPTEMLKLVISLLFDLQSINFKMSGWSMRSIPMLAPRLEPPCFTASVATLNTFMKLIGPLATPPVELTTLPSQRSLENENPVPPPLL